MNIGSITTAPTHQRIEAQNSTTLHKSLLKIGHIEVQTIS
jgi:hypothetical protein